MKVKVFEKFNVKCEFEVSFNKWAEQIEAQENEIKFIKVCKGEIYVFYEPVMVVAGEGC